MTANSTGMTGKTANNEVEAIKAGKLILFICTLKAFESPLYIGIVKSRVKNVFIFICVLGVSTKYTPKLWGSLQIFGTTHEK